MIGKVSLSHQQISAQLRGEQGHGEYGGHRAHPRAGGAHPVPPLLGIDSWLSLVPVHPDQEVQGEIHLEVKMPEQGHPRVLRCHLIAAR